MSKRIPRNGPKKNPFELTPRERQVLELSKQGMDQKQIAAALGIADHWNVRKALISAKEKIECQGI